MCQTTPLCIISTGATESALGLFPETQTKTNLIGPSRNRTRNLLIQWKPLDRKGHIKYKLKVSQKIFYEMILYNI